MTGSTIVHSPRCEAGSGTRMVSTRLHGQDSDPQCHSPACWLPVPGPGLSKFRLAGVAAAAVRVCLPADFNRPRLLAAARAWIVLFCWPGAAGVGAQAATVTVADLTGSKRTRLVADWQVKPHCRPSEVANGP
jgi:hypothetical protein